MNLLRTIRLDASDTFIFESAAEPGEWAVSGAFAFWAGNPDDFSGKKRAAFRGGFLGVESLGWSTLVQVVEVSEADRTSVVERLAQRLVEAFGAPDLETARRAAEEEVAFAASLAEQPKDTLVAVHRRFEDGEVREAFRTLQTREGPKPLRAFSFMEVEGEDDQPADDVDLVSLAEQQRK
ncbi:MAG: DUF6505 family protein [Rhizobiaceae bacterium]